MQNPPPVPLLPDQILTLTDTSRSASSHQQQPYCFPSMLAVVCQHLLLVLKEKEEVGHLQAGCYHPGCIYLSMEGAWTQDKHSCHSELQLGKGGEEDGAVPPFFPSSQRCLVPKSIEQCVTAWADSRQDLLSSSLHKINIPDPHAVWGRQEKNYARSRQVHFHPPLNTVIFASRHHP